MRISGRVTFQRGPWRKVFERLGLFLACLTTVASGCSHGVSRKLDQHFRSRTDGIDARYPTGWRISTRNDTFVPNPALCFRLSNTARASRNDPIEIKLVEYLPPFLTKDLLTKAIRSTHQPAFPHRPARFRLSALRPGDNDWTKGRTLAFQERGRGFYVGVTVRGNANGAERQTISTILDSLRVTHGRCKPSEGVGSEQ